jgi:glucose-6-phosphate isomerase
LQYAPEQFKQLWEESAPEQKVQYMKHVEFTVDGPNITGKSGEKYQVA